MADELPEKVRAKIAASVYTTDEDGRRWVELTDTELAAWCRLAIEESTRSLREKLERAQGALRCLEDHAGLVWHRPEVALAIREAKESAHD